MPSTRFFRNRAKACINNFVDSLPVGRFEGEFSLKWKSPEQFHYIPDADPFRFIRRDAGGNDIQTVQPGEMDTDGGSVPKLAQVVAGLSPWEYGPAYIIHDWQFEDRDNVVRAGGLYPHDFEDVNKTLAEAIWTLMLEGYGKRRKPKRDPAAVYTVFQGVNFAFGRGVWDDI